MAIETIDDLHRQTTRMDTPEVVRRLNAHLGPTLVALLAGANDRKLPHKWAKADGPTPRDEAQKRLMQAHRVWTLISDAENDSVARAWFIGANPRLGENAPVDALRDGRLRDVMAAATAFVEGTDD